MSLHFHNFLWIPSVKCCFAQNYWAGIGSRATQNPVGVILVELLKKDDDDSVDILADHFVLVNKKNPPKELLISKAK